MIGEVRRFIVYAAVGAAATGVHYAVMASLVRWAYTPEVFATCVGYLSGSLVKYPLNYGMVFSSRERHAVAVPRYLLSIAIGFGLNALVFATLLRLLNTYYMVSQVLTTGIVLFANYLLARFWIFRSSAGRGEKAP